ncbi:OmpA/MotB family protein [Reinekea marinisedimentorum]|uniref:OmpA family protein n=1 Tax=Reinekea marinisedimentorum TaxID=230495 RepID=A0A4R3I3T4_9GAMM|nr:OmpA family protein [Reinekea marinisedimentorum]TCS39954.1 OmpA family protein [Reinekea marinisedimentorum]
MNRLNSSQQTIFLAIFLAASLIGNIFLFSGNSGKASQLEQQSAELNKRSSEIEQLTNQLAENQRKTRQSESTLSSVGGQQRELQAIAKEMQVQLLELTEAYQKNLVTAEQTKQQLSAAEAQRKELEARLRDQQASLQEAQKTISNQQRLLRANTLPGDSEKQLKNQQALSSLSGKLKADYPNVLLRQSQSGAGVIEIPLTYLFEQGTTKLNASSPELLKPITATLLELPDTSIEVIGHSDSRPIVSDMGLIYPTNWELSSARASKVAQQLKETGIAEQRLTVMGKAANVPVRDEQNELAWQINRRIEIRFN